MVGVLAVELFANSADTIDKIDTDVAYSKYTSYEPYMTQTRNAVSMMKEYDPSLFYRMEATFHRTVKRPYRNRLQRYFTFKLNDERTCPYDAPQAWLCLRRTLYKI